MPKICAVICARQRRNNVRYQVHRGDWHRTIGLRGVGKTSLVQLLCHGEATNNPAYTIGCSVEVALHEYKAGTADERTYFVELWDIGGATQHKNSRYIFYNPFHGIILVHDLTNRKSHQNLRKWLTEVLNKGTSKGNNREYNECDFDPEQFAGNQIPILVVGTKVDLAQSLRDNFLSKRSTVAEECGAGEINLDCKQKKFLAPGSTNAVKVAKFFDKVIERRFYNRELGGQAAMLSGFIRRT
ncbi:rab-like protein 3 isoform X3 [Octopus bimaculoides]|uniref:rab-like protein 3 isoform X3 n=1 Tax=Octopus bimaculoides TaxID=37653 RepID=UPI00071D0565|nr:rab-like protein 3 isoform X3 [Octopus bimaculoides]XP_014773983.1 rab-like protein 3 isoform X3 [Octopus bimaculoides]|eukprot:XP_014773972.1 PREDICTED: rab-like protein 3 isoform X3 [Octopus bimaculoides]